VLLMGVSVAPKLSLVLSEFTANVEGGSDE
jgi:hypothetical protein